MSCAQVLEGLDVQVLDIYHSVDASDGELPLRGFQMKAFAVLHSSFEQVLWLDSDAVPARNLTTLFDNSLFQRHGSLFWQDWSLDPHWLTAEWMAVYGMQMRAGEREVEAGQFVLQAPRVAALAVGGVHEPALRALLPATLRRQGHVALGIQDGWS